MGLNSNQDGIRSWKMNFSASNNRQQGYNCRYFEKECDG